MTATAEATPMWALITFPNPPGHRLPAWRRTIHVRESDGVLYVPAATAGNEPIVVMCASWDGEPVLMSKGHTYVRMEWLKKEHPENADVWAAIESKVAAALKQETNK